MWAMEECDCSRVVRSKEISSYEVCGMFYIPVFLDMTKF